MLWYCCSLRNKSKAKSESYTKVPIFISRVKLTALHVTKKFLGDALEDTGGWITWNYLEIILHTER